ncbi:hypothetical protein NHX12_024133, partial [Muraenolepis orangiensis]
TTAPLMRRSSAPMLDRKENLALLEQEQARGRGEAKHQEKLREEEKIKEELEKRSRLNPVSRRRSTEPLASDTPSENQQVTAALIVADGDNPEKEVRETDSVAATDALAGESEEGVNSSPAEATADESSITGVSHPLPRDGQRAQNHTSAISDRALTRGWLSEEQLALARPTSATQSLARGFLAETVPGPSTDQVDSEAGDLRWTAAL